MQKCVLGADSHTSYVLVAQLCSVIPGLVFATSCAGEVVTMGEACYLQLHGFP